MSASVKCGVLLGQMLEVIRNYNDDVGAEYDPKVTAVVAELAKDAQGREKLWAALAKMSGAAGHAGGAVEVAQDDGDSAVSTETANRNRELYDAALQAADVIPLEGVE